MVSKLTIDPILNDHKAKTKQMIVDKNKLTLIVLYCFLFICFASLNHPNNAECHTVPKCEKHKPNKNKVEIKAISDFTNV